MRHRIKGRHFNRPADQRKALYRSLVRSVIINERITTTEAKAKEAKALVEKLITYGKKGSLHDRRQAMSFLPDSRVYLKYLKILVQDITKEMVVTPEFLK